MSKYIVNGDVVKLVSDKFTDEGFKRGQLLYVAGHKALPVADNDPYTQRIKFFCNILSKDGTLDPKLYLLDPNSIHKIGNKQKEHFIALIKEKYGTDSSN